MTKEFTFKLRVYSEDTDSFGIVHHSNYLRYMERARLEWFLSLGQRLDHWIAQGILFVLHRAEIDYLAPARVYDELEIITRVVSARRVSVVYEQTIRSAEKKDLIFCIGHITVVCVSARMRPQVLPELIVRGMTDDN